jgi:hypothetical protein
MKCVTISETLDAVLQLSKETNKSFVAYNDALKETIKAMARLEERIIKLEKRNEYRADANKD